MMRRVARIVISRAAAGGLEFGQLLPYLVVACSPNLDCILVTAKVEAIIVKDEDELANNLKQPFRTRLGTSDRI
jgi:hypothetical protein